MNEGKVRHCSLYEVNSDTFRCVHAIFLFNVFQSEYAMKHRDRERKTIPTLKELGTSLVAYSPLGIGFLTRNSTTVNKMKVILEAHFPDLLRSR